VTENRLLPEDLVDDLRATGGFLSVDESTIEDAPVSRALGRRSMCGRRYGRRGLVTFRVTGESISAKERQKSSCVSHSTAYNHWCDGLLANLNAGSQESWFEIVGRLDKGQPGSAGGPVEE